MIREQVEAMGDEELSRLCAERVMGWNESVIGIWESNGKWIGKSSRDVDYEDRRWDPAANMEDAWDLVEEMRRRESRDFLLQMTGFEDGLPVGLWYDQRDVIARRICLAALTAVGAIEEEP